MEVLEELLIVDDEATFLKSAEEAFGEYGFAARGVQPAEVDALLASGATLGAAVVDLYMPGRDGIVIAELLTAADPDLVLFFLSGNLEVSQFRARARRLKLNVADWLEKPIPGSSKEAARFFRGLHSRILSQRFASLAARWRREVQFISSSNQAALHPAYQRIIGLGPAVVPLILDDLAREPERWFWALKAITGHDPIRPQDRGDLAAMSAAWLDWAKKGQRGSRPTT